MKESLKDILGHLHSEVDQKTLLKYLEGKLSAAEQHEVEKKSQTDAFEADALDGLQGFTNKQKIASLVAQLNADLKKKTEKAQKRPHKRQAKVEPWLLITIVIVLLIAVISYFVIHKMQGR